ncbi:cupin [Actinomadura sediminis]|uniref:Cupin n=1 Tax=Actinomadura sediminis TaxID=1038904 RepID=A0ABW3F400_9ACTN
MTLTPIDLFASPIHLRDGGTIHAARRTADPGRDGWRLTALHARTGADVRADHWEAHPEAEEIVSCLIGKIRLYLRPERPGQREEEIRLTAGTAAIVPRGRWHRIELDTPSTIMAVTLPNGSRLERRTGGEAPAPAVTSTAEAGDR